MRDFPSMMPLVVLGVILLGVYLLVRALTGMSAWISGARYRAYRQLAARYHGRYETRGLSDPPTVSFSHNGSAIRVGLAPTIAGQPGQIPRTRVVARFRRGIPFRMELAPIARPAPPQAPKGTRPVKIGDPDFDHSFVVQANDAEMARDFLNSSIRRSVTALHRGVQPGGMLVSINPERILVQLDRNLAASSEALAWMVREALVLHDGLLDGVVNRIDQGIAIVDPAGTWEEDSGPPTCKVCGELVFDDQVIVCKACNTPHHRDCWEYIGGCSIYGCNGKVGVPQ
jgi:hypothetical protein